MGYESPICEVINLQQTRMYNKLTPRAMKFRAYNIEKYK
jgi:hypothetical protein